MGRRDQAPPQFVFDNVLDGLDSDPAVEPIDLSELPDGPEDVCPPNAELPGEADAVLPDISDHWPTDVFGGCFDVELA